MQIQRRVYGCDLWTRAKTGPSGVRGHNRAGGQYEDGCRAGLSRSSDLSLPMATGQSTGNKRAPIHCKFTVNDIVDRAI